MATVSVSVFGISSDGKKAATMAAFLEPGAANRARFF
jgi:hypothetical protein